MSEKAFFERFICGADVADLRSVDLTLLSKANDGLLRYFSSGTLTYARNWHEKLYVSSR